MMVVCKMKYYFTFWGSCHLWQPIGNLLATILQTNNLEILAECQL